MKIKSIIAGLLLSAVAANASVTISGASIFNTAMNGYSTGVYVASSSNAFDVSLFDFSGSLDFGISFATGSTFNGYTVLGSASIYAAGGSSVLTAGITYNLGGNVATGNEIGVLVFENSTTSIIGGDTWQVYTNDWVVAADGSNLSLTGTGAPFQGPPVVVVPEPSSYALLGGLLALGCVMLRRRA